MPLLYSVSILAYTHVSFVYSSALRNKEEKVAVLICSQLLVIALELIVFATASLYKHNP